MLHLCLTRIQASQYVSFVGGWSNCLPSFANSSALSLPLTQQWAGIHWSTTSDFLERVDSWCFSSARPGSGLLASRACSTQKDGSLQLCRLCDEVAGCEAEGADFGSVIGAECTAGS